MRLSGGGDEEVNSSASVVVNKEPVKGLVLISLGGHKGSSGRRSGYRIKDEYLRGLIAHCILVPSRSECNRNPHFLSTWERDC